MLDNDEKIVFKNKKSQGDVSDFNNIIFKETSFSDIIEDIYNSKQKRSQKINELIEHLNSLVKNITDATIIVPVLNQCFETEIDNDELLVKTAAIIQRSISNERSFGESDGQGSLSISEKEMSELEEMRTKLLNSPKPKQLEEKCIDLIEMQQIDFDVTSSDDTFDKLRKDIEQLMEDTLDTTNSQFKTSD